MIFLNFETLSQSNNMLKLKMVHIKTKIYLYKNRIYQELNYLAIKYSIHVKKESLKLSHLSEVEISK